MAIAFQPTHPLTTEELDQLSRTNPAVRFERGSRGELIVSPTGTLGGRGEFEMARQLDLWAQRDGRGFITPASAGFTLSDGSVFAPDTAWIAHERWEMLSAEERQGYARIAPDVAFELLSPNDTLREAREKAAIYLRNGTRLVVLIEPSTRSVELHRLDGIAVAQTPTEHLPLDPELPGFTLDIGRILASMENAAARKS